LYALGSIIAKYFLFKTPRKALSLKIYSFKLSQKKRQQNQNEKKSNKRKIKWNILNSIWGGVRGT
jgi:hypothetical protein